MAARGGGRGRGVDLDPDRRRRERRQPRRRRAGRRDGRLRADRDQALEGRRARGGDRDRRGAARLCLQRPRRAGRDRGRGPGRADAERARAAVAWLTGSPPSASSPRRSPRSSASCATGCSTHPRARASASRSTRRRSTPTGSSARVLASPDARGPHQRQHRPCLGLRRGAGPLRAAARGRLPRLALDAAGAGALAPAGDRGERDRRRALRRLLRARRRPGKRRAGGACSAPRAPQRPTTIRRSARPTSRRFR